MKKNIATASTGRSMGAVRWVGGLLLITLLCACSQAARQASAVEPTSETPCALDGMILNDFPGPKAQIQYMEGNPDFFCELTELFSVLLKPEHRRAIAGVLVQDMGKTEWDHPHGNWINAKTAVYVVGSRKRGSMGPTFGSFSRMQDAQTFMRKEGGRIVRFTDIDSSMLNISVGVTDDARM